MRHRSRLGAAMWTYVWIAIGSAAGGLARYGTGTLVARCCQSGFPWATLLVNVSGSLLIGVLASLTLDDRPMLGSEARALLIVGLCGGFTTFSSFSLETLRLMRDGEWPWATANVVLSVLLCLAAVWLGTLLAAALSR
jgi:CrcB protein